MAVGMKRLGSKHPVGLAFAALVIALQWFIVAGFVAHAYTWWLKVHDTGAVTAGITGTLFFLIGSAAAVAHSIRAYSQLHSQSSRLKHLAQLIGMAGLSGLLVFASMVWAGVVLIVQR